MTSKRATQTQLEMIITPASLKHHSSITQLEQRLRDHNSEREQAVGLCAVALGCITIFTDLGVLGRMASQGPKEHAWRSTTLTTDMACRFPRWNANDPKAFSRLALSILIGKTTWRDSTMCTSATLAGTCDSCTAEATPGQAWTLIMHTEPGRQAQVVWTEQP